MYKAITLCLALSAPALAIKKPAHGAAALRVRGGTFGFDAHQTGEQCGIEEPEKEVVKTIKSAVTYPIKKVFGIARGGALLDCGRPLRELALRRLELRLEAREARGLGAVEHHAEGERRGARLAC